MASHNGTKPTETSPLLSPSTAANTNDERTILVKNVSSTKTWIILSAAYVGVFLGAMDATIVATLSPPISSEFHSLSLLSWLATAYLIANAACQPVSGRLTDIFGRGPGLVFSNVFFAAGNLMCGLARSEGTMIAGRVVSGIGGGGLMSITTFLASDLVPLRQRGVVQGLGNICYGTGAMLGGVYGGWINDTAEMGWRLAFLIQVPIILVSGTLVFFLVNVPPKESEKSLLARIDFTGVFLSISFLVILLLGLNAGGNVLPWSSPWVLATLPISAVLLAVFIWWELRAPQPVIPIRLLADRTVIAACLANFFGNMVNFALFYYVVLYLQVRGYTPTQAGMRTVLPSFGITISSVGVGLIMRHTGKYVVTGRIGLFIFVIGGALFTTLGANTPDWVVFAAFGISGLGFGSMLVITLIACIAAVDHSQQAVITSATYAFRSMGSTLGISVASAVYQNILKARLWERYGDLPGAAAEIKRLRDDLDELKHLPEGRWRDGGVMESFMEAFSGIWWTAFGLAVAAFVSMCFIKQYTLHSNLERAEEEGEGVGEEGAGGHIGLPE